MAWSEREWANWGRALLALWGLSCLLASAYDGAGAFSWFTTTWLSALGVLSLWLAAFPSKDR